MATSYELRQPGTPESLPVIEIASDTFANGGAIPMSAASSYCGGGDVSPDLRWSGAPANTQSYVVTCFDPDAPTGVGFWHWTLMNVPPSVTSLAADVGQKPPQGAVAGYTDYGTSGYGGPCPPEGESHRYVFTVSALDIPQIPGVGEGTTGAYLTFSMRGHIIARGTYAGHFSR
jgi:Raf kinase inhibitor-like YbhB/YbcL family protein